MNKKIIGIIVCMLLFIGFSIFPCTGRISNNNDVVIKNMLYDHDVGIKNITQPCGYVGDNSWIFFHHHYHPRNWSITHEDQFEAAIRITPSELDDYGGWNLSIVKFFHVTNYSEIHSGTIRIYDAGNSTSPGSLITSEPFNVTGEGWFEIDLSSPITLDVDEDVWVSVHVNCSTYELPVGNDESSAKEGRGDWINLSGVWKELKDLGIDRNWCIKAGIKPWGQEIVFFQPGTKPIEAIVENLGAYPETNLSVSAKIFYKDLLVYQNNATILQLDSGNETEVVFNDWNAADEGVYILEINVSLDTDEFLDNNIKTMFIGVDDDDPTTIHFFDPPISEWVNYGIGSNITVTFVAIDFMSDVKEIRYDVGSGWQIIPGDYGSAIFELVEDLWIEYYAVDYVGNEESHHSLFFDLDLTPPETSLGWEVWKEGGKWYVKFTCDATDATSGMDRVEMYINDGFHEEIVGAGPTYEFVIEWCKAFKSCTLKFVFYDVAGNSAIESVNGSDINSYSSSQSSSNQQSSNMWFLRWLERFPILQKILDVLRLNIR